MITLHKLNGTEIFLNADLIESLEPRGGESVVALATGNKYLVTESAQQVSDKVIEYKRKISAEVAAQGKPVNPIKSFVRENP
jgi:flagellar protein FlbD